MIENAGLDDVTIKGYESMAYLSKIISGFRSTIIKLTQEKQKLNEENKILHEEIKQLKRGPIENTVAQTVLKPEYR